MKKCERKRNGKRKNGKKEKRKSGKKRNGENYKLVKVFALFFITVIMCNFSAINFKQK
ncbi:MAG: hypothetical protein QXL57_00340 [Candidatus Bathyarchaeia archaeon]